MGWVLRAECAACGHGETDLRLGATHGEIGQHDVCHRDLFRAPCCGRLESVLLYLGQPLPAAACSGCGQALVLDAAHRYRIATLKGERLDRHPCPRCGVVALAFEKIGTFL